MLRRLRGRAGTLGEDVQARRGLVAVRRAPLGSLQLEARRLHRVDELGEPEQRGAQVDAVCRAFRSAQTPRSGERR
jgi:hypothetical protein